MSPISVTRDSGFFVFCFFFNRSLLEYNCFTILCQFLLYNKANQPYAYTCPHIPSLLSLPPILPIPPLQVITKYHTDLPVLCCCFPPANYFTFGSVYTSFCCFNFCRLCLGNGRHVSCFAPFSVWTPGPIGIHVDPEKMQDLWRLYFTQHAY